MVECVSNESVFITVVHEIMKIIMKTKNDNLHLFAY